MKSLVRDMVLDRIKPTDVEHEEFQAVALKLSRKIKRAANRLEIKCEVKIGGSFGKGTYLKGSSDVDYFVRFDSSYNDEMISSMLEKILVEAKVKHKKQKGSRDYFSGLFGPRDRKIKFEAVPVRRVRSVNDALNSTDLSSFHVDFVLEKITERPELADEIRLAKQFFKAKQLYGAESYIGGFSGHVIDILIIYYGSLSELIEASKSWDEMTYIDVCEHHETPHDGLKEIGNDKRSDLVMIDPIIPNRNAARALSSENYGRFLLIANSIDELSHDDFEIIRENAKDKIEWHSKFAKVNNLQAAIYEIKFKIKDESEDVCGSKLRKLHGKVSKYLTSHDFVLFTDEFFIDIENGIALFVFLFEKVSLPKVKKVYGPKVHMKDAMKSFLATRGDYFIEDGRVCVYEERTVTKLSEIVKLDKTELEKMLGRDISFVKSVRVRK